jgi:hypothetical protein
MSDLSQTVESLRETSDELKRRGIDDLAQRLDRAIADLGASPSNGTDLLTLHEAASALGVRSITTIARWITDGALQVVRGDKQALIPRASVDAMRDDPRLAEYLAWQQQLAEALAPFGDGDEPPEEFSALWEGRKPWEQRSAGTNPSNAG